MRIGSALRKGSAARITGSAIAAAGLTFLGLGTAGVGTITGGASSPNHCTAADVLAKGGSSSKVISNDQGTCDVAGNTTTLPAFGYVAFQLSSGGTTTLRDILQSDGNDHDFYVGTYTLSFSNLVDQTHSANAVTTTSGTYTLAPGADEGETGGLASTYPTEPAVTGTLPTISGIAGDEVTAAYEVQFSATGPQETYQSEKNDIFFNQGADQESQAASESVTFLGIDSTTTSTTSSTPTTSSTTQSSSSAISSSAPTTTSSDTGTTSSNDPTVSTGSNTTQSSSTTSSTTPTTTSSSTSSTTPTTTSSSTTSATPATTSSSSSSNAPTTTSSSTNSAAPTTTATGDPPASTTTGSSSTGASTTRPASSSDPSAVLGNGASTPSTGADIQFGAGLALLTLGGGLIVGSSRRTRRTRP
jgi:hypothetical protein